MFNFFKRRGGKKKEIPAAYKAGGELGAELGEAVSEYLDGRLPQVNKNILEVFRRLLSEIYDHDDETQMAPQQIAFHQWTIFLENLDDYKTRVMKDAAEELSNEFDCARAAGVEVEDALNAFLDAAITEAETSLVIDCYCQLASSMTEADERNPYEESMSLLAKAATLVEGLPEQLLQEGE